MRRKWIALLLFLLISACQSVSPTLLPISPSQLPQDTSTPNPTQPVTAIPRATPTPASSLGVAPTQLRGVTLTFWHPLYGEPAKTISTIVADFNQNNIWGIRVNTEVFYNLTGLEDKVNLNRNTSNLPDVIMAPPEMIASWQDQHQFIASATSYIQDSVWGLTPNEIADIRPSFWVEQNRLSLPLQRSAALLFYNQTWAQELGYRIPPTTPEEFRIQACAAAKANLSDSVDENNGLGGWFLERDALTLISWMEAFNANPIKSQSGLIKFNTPAAVSTFTYLRKLLDNGCSWTSQTTSPGDAFIRRWALFYSGTLEELQTQEKSRKVNRVNDQWTLIPYPSEHNSRSVFISGLDGAILHGKPTQQLAGWLFLRWMLLPRSQAILASAGATLPVRISSDALLSEYSQTHPQWAAVSKLTDDFKPAPQIASWRTARRILEDAAWQIFQPYVPANRIPTILQEMDSTLEELLKRSP